MITLKAIARARSVSIANRIATMRNLLELVDADLTHASVDGTLRSSTSLSTTFTWHIVYGAAGSAMLGPLGIAKIALTSWSAVAGSEARYTVRGPPFGV